MIACVMVLLSVFTLAQPALAHTGGLEPWLAAQRWNWNPLVIFPLALSMTLYVSGVGRVWQRAGAGKGVRRWQVRCFALGWCLLVLALVAPLHWLGEHLFVAHMVEHELLMTLAAPLIAVARPAGAMFWGLPQSWRGPIGAIGQSEAFSRLWRRLTGPGPATVLHGAALWTWHVPVLYEAALSHNFLHWLQHLSFFLTALLFWWALLRGKARERGYGVAVLCLFATALHTAALGIFLTLARRQLYPLQTQDSVEWGVSSLEDQQLAGLVMWVPAGLAYAIAALVLAAIWIRWASKEPLDGMRRSNTSSHPANLQPNAPPRFARYQRS
jgi:cytochrome c oxidase assembly factor CtaG